jgi:hypothetical protein
MPPLRPISFSSDYNPGDVSMLLQSGGLELLEAKTIFALRDSESTVRGALSLLGHVQKLSDELIVPNLDQDISFFYDPATKQLRKRFSQFPDAMQSIADFFHEEERANKVLLERIQAERKRRW